MQSCGSGALNTLITNPILTERLKQTDEGKVFLEVWPTISTTIDLAQISTELLTSFVKNSKSVSNVLSDLPEAEAKRLDDLIAKSDEVLVKRGVGAAYAGSVFKVGDNIAGKIIVQVKAGINGKIAVIGRKMDGHVNEAINSLQSQGKQVEAFNDVFQSGKSFNIDGANYSWQEIVDDFGNINGKYSTNSDGWIIDEELPNTLMYKANQKWVQKLLDDGYEIIDIGYPINNNTPSVFYNMELNVIFP
ncbi:hypothetical protein QUH73_16960 [Labilibaculum sp. K2S]|uniref:hypothetical protein n=1 Tax=Labilibaculum sp. K2S TaxID=3056386 RepID=UPI0025A328BB|nr:hypothetical protein [Labilibaculum sp. K2S]MDM8161514.1 hypothetical protein [Labilibaculum sp. K2S]